MARKWPIITQDWSAKLKSRSFMEMAQLDMTMVMTVCDTVAMVQLRMKSGLLTMEERLLPTANPLIDGLGSPMDAGWVDGKRTRDSKVKFTRPMAAITTKEPVYRSENIVSE
jgi:hypothetical protein